MRAEPGESQTLHYQWYKLGAALHSATANNPTLIIESVDYRDFGLYHVVVTVGDAKVKGQVISRDVAVYDLERLAAGA